MRLLTFCLLPAALGFAGCGYIPEQRATSGAALGAGTRARVSSGADAGRGGIIASSLVGVVVGALIGATTWPFPPRPAYDVALPPLGARRCVEFAEDIYRRLCCRAFDGA